jgi:sugar phosphate permease
MWVRVGVISILWSINGAGQAIAWPALARVFMAWFPDKTTRGTWYSILATNQNLGGIAAPRLYPPLMAAYGWMSAMYVPAFITVVYAGAMKMSLSSSPEHTAAAAGDKRDNKDHAAALAAAAQEAPGLVETFRYLLTNQSFLLLSFAYIPVMVIRISLATWTAAIFEESSMSLVDAALALSALEIGGFAGSTIGGWVSDTMFDGRRGPVMCIFRCVMSKSAGCAV